MRRVGGVLLLALTAVVVVGLGYVLVHHDRVPRAGQTPGYTPSPLASIAPTPSPSPSTPRTSTSSSPTGSSTSSTTSDAAADARVTILGDDWAIGTGASSSSTPWTAQVGKRLGVPVTAIGANGAGYAAAAANGDTYEGLLDRVVRSKPTVLVVIGGRNDADDDAAALKQGASSFFAEVHRRMPKVRVYAVAPFWGDSPHPAKLKPVDDAVRDGVRAAGGTYLDLADPIAGHPSWMADSAHPDDRGYRAIADAMVAALRSRLAG